MREMFTIGHSNHTLEHFVNLLTTHGISAIADVRSSPYSEYSPQFNKEILRQKLQNANNEYVFLGRYCQMLWMRLLADASFVPAGRAEADPLRGGPQSFHPPSLRSQIG